MRCIVHLNFAKRADLMLSIPIINKSWVKEDEEKKREGGREGKGGEENQCFTIINLCLPHNNPVARHVASPA